MDVKDLNETYERLQIAVKCPGHLKRSGDGTTVISTKMMRVNTSGQNTPSR